MIRCPLSLARVGWITALIVVFASAAGLAAEKVRIGYVHVFDDAPVLIARDAGFYEQLGLDAEVTAFNSGPTLVKGLVTGQLDFGVLGFTNALTWSAEGADLRILAKVQEGYHAIIVRRESGIRSVADLRGKTLASQAVGSTADVVLKGVVFAGAGLSDRDVNMVYTAPATALQSLRAGRVDAAFLFEPFDRIARLTLAVDEIYEIGKEWPFPCMVIIAPGKLVDERPDLIRKVLAANKLAVEFMAVNPEEAARILAPAFVAEEQVHADSGPVPATEVILGALETNVFDWRLSERDLDRMAELKAIMERLGLLKSPVDLDAVVDLRFQRELEAGGI